MITIDCQLTELIKIKDNEYWLVEDKTDKIKYTIPISEFRGLDLTIGDKYKFIKEYNKSSKKYFLVPLINKNYEAGKIYDFEIVNNISNSSGGYHKISVKDISGNIISVSSHDWQTQNNWKFKTLKCQVTSFRNGIPILINKDTRHSIFEMGMLYEFKVTGFKTTTSSLTKKESLFFELQGVDNCQYFVPILPIQEEDASKIESITCETIHLNNELKLKQVLLNDPFFIEAEKILADKTLLNKFFQPFIEKSPESADEKKFQEQYFYKSAFWIITYCDKLLPKLFFENIYRLDYKSATQINELIIKFEEWIIRKGIIKSFANAASRKHALQKAELQLNKHAKIKEVLSLFTTPQNITLSRNLINGLDAANLYYVIKFSDFQNIDEKLFIPKIESTFANTNRQDDEWYYLYSLEHLIANNKTKFISKEENENFNIVVNVSKRFTSPHHQEKYFNWSYCHYLLNRYLGNSERANLIQTKIIKEFFHIEKSLRKRQTLIQNAFAILNNIKSYGAEDLFIFNGSLKFNKKYEGINPTHNNYNELDWKSLNKSFETKNFILVNIVNKTSFGFDIIYNGIKGFISNQEITSSELKKYEFEEIDFTISAECILVCEDFNYFIAKQLTIEDANYFIKNNKSLELKEGIICDGYVRTYKDFGLFVNTIFGTGLLHVNQISSHIWDELRLKRHFSKSNPLKVQVLNTNYKGKGLELSFKSIEYTEFKNHYLEFVDRVDNDYVMGFEVDTNEQDITDDFHILSNNIHYEKALCFEQYAILQNDLFYKIDLLNIAKQFHSSVNNARSYLLNIFIQYFQILVLVKKSIDNYSTETWQLVKDEAQKTKSDINLKTIAVFPDANNLIYFLDILSLFNEKSDDSIAKLYKYVVEYTDNKGKTSLKTIAKIALSNNLMISETIDENEFSLKNLKIINSYLESGVLSLKESDLDKLKRELNEERKYWKGVIKEDEGQSLEFKQTLLVPNFESKKDGFVKELSKVAFDDLVKKRKKIILHSAFKSLCAFANCHGGTLLIGVSDNKKITGLEIDYESLTQSDRDGFGKRFDDEIKKYFGDSFSHLLDKKFLLFEEGDVLIVKVKSSPDEVFLLRDEEGKSTEELYIRNLSSVEQLKGRELATFVKRKHSEQLKINVEKSLKS